MAQVQFNSYAGGPHGGSPVVLPGIKPSFLGDLGSMFNQLGQIPAEMQQAQLKQKLNDLLIKSLTTPQTIQQTTPGSNMMVPKEGTTIQPLEESGQSLAGMMPATPESIGNLFSQEQGPSTTKTVANPAFSDITNRMEAIGPAFGWKFPTPIENIYATYLAKSAGLGALETQKQEGREKIQSMKGEQGQELQATKGEQKTELEGIRQKGRMDQIDKLTASREKIASEGNQRMRDIAADRNLNDQQKIDKILSERTNFHQGELKNYDQRTKVLQQGAESLNDIRNIQQINSYKDDLTKQLSQIDKILAKKGEPEVKGELSQAVSNYNDLVDKIMQLDPGSNLTKMEQMDAPGVMNWIRGQNIPLLPTDQPHQTVVPKPAGTPPPKPNARQATPTPPAANQSPTTNALPNGTYTPSTITPEELKRRRDNIFRKAQ